MRPFKKTLWLSLALTAAIWMVFSWPLPRHVGSAIPSSSTKAARGVAVQPMQPGDHLQLDYHFWLFSDMVAGTTPWFFNLYEFNTGDDAERREPGAYYLPFSLFYTVGAWIGGRAFAWNLAGFIGLWLTAWFTWLLARRYTNHAAAAWVAAAVAIAVPYRWINIAGGSPTGFGIAFVPLLFYGLDIAVRDDKPRGGMLAGIALLMAGWSDPHTFFFCALATPFWCIFSFIHREAFDWKPWRSYGRLAVALAPVLVFTALACLSNQTNAKHIGEAKTAVRTFAEVSLFSPQLNGLWSWEVAGISDHIYLGVVAPALIVAGLVLGFRQKRLVASLLLIAAAMFVAIELSLGPNGLHGGYFFRLARRLVSHYGMIRQPAKVFCLMPTLVALAAAISLSAFRSPRAAACLLGGLLLLEWRMHFEPTVGRFNLAEPAYAAVAKSADREPRALILPLWPGDSHYSSVYEHNVSLYRIRMLNGYRPYVSTNYVALVRHLDSANLGILNDAQLDDLQDRGIDFILFHENLFPEKVSVFPSSFTLRNLLNHPRLERLEQSGPVWAFRIKPAQEEAQPTSAQAFAIFPAMRLEWENIKPVRIAPRDDASASDQAFVRLDKDMHLAPHKPVHAAWADGMRWLVRVRGHGTLRLTAGTSSVPAEVDSSDWTWKAIPVSRFEHIGDVTPAVACDSGSVDLDSSLLTAGPWQPIAPGKSVSLPASTFIHSGYSHRETGSVAFTPEYNGPGLVLIGPRLPVEPGRYRIGVDVASSAPSGTELGTFSLRHEGGPDLRQFPAVVAGNNSVVLSIVDNRPLVLALVYKGETPCEVVRVVIERMP